MTKSKVEEVDSRAFLNKCAEWKRPTNDSWIMRHWKFFARITSVKLALEETAATFTAPFQNTSVAILLCKKPGSGREQSMSGNPQKNQDSSWLMPQRLWKLLFSGFFLL
jgi:hypothetical protein